MFDVLPFEINNENYFLFIGIVCTIFVNNGTPPLFDVLPFEINNENYFLLIGIFSTIFCNFPHGLVG